MRLNRDILFLISVGMLVAVVVLATNLLLPGNSVTSQSPLQPTGTFQSNVIAQENALQGTSSWEIPGGRGATTQIQAYASATSVQPGQALTFYVSTQVDGTLYSIGIYRLGWYAGLGGRLQTLLPNRIGHAQGYYDSANHHLVDCTSCHIDTKTGLVEANWQPSYTLTIPYGWVTGVYLAKFADANGMQTYVSFDVKGNSHSPYVVVTTDTTFAAYNKWGGYSLYEADSSASTDNLEITSASRGVKVSFDRPYSDGYGSGLVFPFEVDAIHWLERQGYDLSYMSSVDLHENPKQLLHHRAYLSVGHDEYWTKEMRDGVEYARDHGVSLAFLGGNDIYWQMRFEPDSKGTPDRTVVCYKVLTGQHDLMQDPFYGKDNARVTTQWRDPVLHRPENALIGIMYSTLTHQVLGFPWQVSLAAKSPLLDGTGLEPGQQYGCGLVGYEWDHVFNNGATPRGLQVLSVSHPRDNNNQPDISNTTYYFAPSGAMVFAAGAIYWTASLDSYRSYTDSTCTHQSPVVPGIQKLMV